jgi:hypothetical protein
MLHIIYDRTACRQILSAIDRQNKIRISNILRATLGRANTAAWLLEYTELGCGGHSSAEVIRGCSPPLSTRDAQCN